MTEEQLLWMAEHGCQLTVQIKDAYPEVLLQLDTRHPAGGLLRLERSVSLHHLKSAGFLLLTATVSELLNQTESIFKESDDA